MNDRGWDDPDRRLPSAGWLERTFVQVIEHKPFCWTHKSDSLNERLFRLAPLVPVPAPVIHVSLQADFRPALD